ncbi:MAG TPA: hypothetical protein VE913_09680, partial [Longimicrobium sp.]|nr:hypothetical protein [Longimicrobium sp.]
ETMEVEGNPRGETFEWIYMKDITRDEMVTVLVVGMAPVGQRGGAGDYTLRIEAPGGGAAPAPAPAPSGRGGGARGAAPAARVLRAGVRVQGELAASDPVLPDDDSHYDDYTYTARAGERITVRLNSTAFDAFLHVGAPGAGSTLQNPVSDDDGGGGTNSRVEYVAARSGPVTVRVNTLSGGETGAYTLMLESTAGQVPTPNGQGPGGQTPVRPAAPAARALRAGQRVEGVLAASAPRLDDGSHYADYTYAARRGERIVVRLDSDAFDAFLHVGRPGAGNALENESSDDDAGGGTNSRVEYVADRDGPVTIRVNTLGGGETGRFSIVVEAVRR